MCGITGYLGFREAYPIVINGLQRLEYRGYDSAGISIKNNNTITTIKEIGEIKNLELSIPKNLQGNIGIGHTRWATHGDKTDINAHPHFDHKNRVALVHNGIINNYFELKKELRDKYGIEQKSQTDTEIVSISSFSNGYIHV